MIEKLNVELTEEEFDSVRIVAQKQGMTVEEWIREAVVKACGHAVADGISRKLAAIRSAYYFQFPTSDMDQMLGEIGRGAFRNG